METLSEVIVKEERQWKRHVRIKFARHMVRVSPAAEAYTWKAVLQRYGVHAKGNVMPSTTTMLERSLERDRKSAEVAVAEAPKE